MKKRLLSIVFVVTTLLLVSSCVKKDDFNDLKKQVEVNTSEIQKLSDLTALLDQAIQNGELITGVNNVTKVVNGQTVNGLEIVFSGDKGTKTVWDGVNGAAVTANTPYLWINTNGNWASNFGSIPADSDNASYELKNGDATIPARGASATEAKIVSSNNQVAFTFVPAVGDPFTVATTVDSRVNAASIQGVILHDDYYIFSINGQDYKVMREVVYPTSITMLANTMLIEKGKKASFNIKVSPHNAAFSLSNLSLDYVASMTRAASSVITNPDFIEVASCETVLKDGVKNGEYTVTVNWLKDVPNKGIDRALFVVINTVNSKKDPIAITSATPVFLTEQIIPIKPEFLNELPDLIMFQGETYTGEITLATGADGKYIWDKGYVSTTAINAASTTYVTTAISTPKFGYSVVAKTEPVIAANTHEVTTATATIQDIVTPTAGSVNKTFNITVYPKPSGVMYSKNDVAPIWIPVADKLNHVNFALSTVLANSGLNTTVWDFSSISTEYFLNGTASSLPAAIITSLDAATTINVDLKPEVMYGKHKLVYNIRATAKKDTRPASLVQQYEFQIVVEFEVVAPIFHIKPNVIAAEMADTMRLSLNEGKLLYTTVRNQAVPMHHVSGSEIFDIKSNTNVSNNNKPYPTMPDAPSYTYAVGSGTQGLVFNPSTPVAVNWTTPTTVTFYSELITGQQIPIQIEGYLTTAAPGVVMVAFERHALVSVNSQTVGVNYSQLKAGATFNLKDAAKANVYGVDAAGKKVHWSCIASVTYAVGNVSISPKPEGMPDKLVTVSAEGVVSALGSATWDNGVTATQPITVTMTDIWGNSANTTLELKINSNSIP